MMQFNFILFEVSAKKVIQNNSLEASSFSGTVKSISLSALQCLLAVLFESFTVWSKHFLNSSAELLFLPRCQGGIFDKTFLLLAENLCGFMFCSITLLHNMLQFYLFNVSGNGNHSVKR